MNNKILIRFGAMQPSIKQQLKEQDFKIDPTECAIIQKVADAITMLFIRNILTDSETKKARNKLFKRIQSSVSYNPPKTTTHA